MSPATRGVFARAEDTITLAFGRFIGMGTQTVSAQARVQRRGQDAPLHATLDTAAPGAFNLQKNAQVTALGCSLYSDSTSPSHGRWCQRHGPGGHDLLSRRLFRGSGQLLADTADRMPGDQRPAPGPSDAFHRRVCDPAVSLQPAALTKAATIDKDVTLEPGTYCFGLQVKKKAVVTMKPGIYVFKDGPLIVKDNATLTGVDVGLYFAGDKAGLLFDKKTTVSLSAPTTGVMGGC